MIPVIVFLASRSGKFTLTCLQPRPTVPRSRTCAFSLQTQQEPTYTTGMRRLQTVEKMFNTPYYRFACEPALEIFGYET